MLREAVASGDAVRRRVQGPGPGRGRGADGPRGVRGSAPLGCGRQPALWWYLVKHRGYPVPSPVLLKKWVDTFVADIRGFAAWNRIPRAVLVNRRSAGPRPGLAGPDRVITGSGRGEPATLCGIY
jgi:hypothetical protein